MDLVTVKACGTTTLICYRPFVGAIRACGPLAREGTVNTLSPSSNPQQSGEVGPPPEKRLCSVCCDWRGTCFVALSSEVLEQMAKKTKRTPASKSARKTSKPSRKRGLVRRRKGSAGSAAAARQYGHRVCGHPNGAESPNSLSTSQGNSEVNDVIEGHVRIR
jgi:hypothetical protein